jgi:phage-related protein
VVSFFAKMEMKALSALTGIGKGILTAGGSIFKLGKRITGLAARVFVFSLITKAFRAMLTNIQSGLDTFLTYDENLKSSIESLKTSLSNVGANLISAFSPIISAVVPYLQTMINWLVTAIDAVGAFFAALTGQTSYKRASVGISSVGDSASSAAGGMNDATQAAKDLKKELAGFDELNVISQDTSSSGSGGSGGSSGSGSGSGITYEEVAVDSAMSDLAGQIKEYFSDIFQPMQEAWDTYGENVINAWKQSLDDIVALLATIAETFRDVWTGGTGEEVCGSILQLLTLIGQAISAIATSFTNAWNDDNRGYDYIDSILLLFDSILDVIQSIGESLVTVWNNGTGETIFANILDILTNIHTTITNIAESFASAWNDNGNGEKIIQSLANNLNTVLGYINNITDGLKAWSKDIDFSPLLNAFNDLVKATAPLGDKLGAGLEWLFTNVLEPLGKWAIEQAIPAALSAVSGALEAIDSVIEAVKPIFTWLWESFLQPLGEWAGSAIISAMTTLSGLLSDFGNWCKNNQEVIQDAVIVVGSFFAAFKATEIITSAITSITGLIGLISGAGGLSVGLEALAGMLGSGGILGIAIGAAVAAGVLLYENWDTIKEKLGNLKEWIAEKWGAIKETVSDVIEIGVGLVKKGWETVKGWLSSLGAAAEGAIETAVSLVKKAGAWAEDAWTALKSGGSTVVSTVQTALKKASTWASEAWSALQSAGESAVTTVQTALKKATTWAADAWTALQNVGETVTTTVQAAVKKATTWVTDAWTALKSEDSITIVSTALKKAGTWVTDAWKTLTSEDKTTTIQAALKKATTWASEAWTLVSTAGGTAITTIQTALQKATTWITDAWKALTSKDSTTTISTALQKAGTWVSDAWKVVSTAGGTATSTVQTALKKATTWVKDAWTAMTTKKNNVTSKVSLTRGWTGTFLKWLTGNSSGKVYATVVTTHTTSSGRTAGGKTGSFAKGGIYSGGAWKSIPQFGLGGILSAAAGIARAIPQFASGGTPNGTLFWAGEAGPEVVGKASGGKTEILNKSQIASAIYSAVLAGMGDMSDYVKSVNATQVTCANAIVATIGSLIEQVQSMRTSAYAAEFANINVGSYNAIADINRINAIRDGVNASGALSSSNTAWMDTLAAKINNGGGNYTFIAQLDGKEIFRETVSQNQMYKNQTGHSAF